MSKPAAPPREPAAIRPDILTPAFLAELRAHGVVSAQLFGSVARREETAESDLDLLVEFDHAASYGERFRLSEELSQICGRRVELVVELHPAFAPFIRPTLIPVSL